MQFNVFLGLFSELNVCSKKGQNQDEATASSCLMLATALGLENWGRSPNGNTIVFIILYCLIFLARFSINLLTFYHECWSLIGYSTRLAVGSCPQNGGRFAFFEVFVEGI